MKRIIVITLCSLSLANWSYSRELPSWSKAESVMKSCYGGWNATVTLSAGLRSEVSRTDSDYNDSIFESGMKDATYEGYGNEASTVSTTTTTTSADGADENGVTDTLSYSNSSEAAYDLYENTTDSMGQRSETAFKHSAYVGVDLKVPLYSREFRLKRKEKTNSEVGKLADLYSKYEGHRATVAALSIEGNVLKQLMMDGGEQAISAYYQMLAEKEKSRALMTGAKRRIFTTLQSCGYRSGK